MFVLVWCVLVHLWLGVVTWRWVSVVWRRGAERQYERFSNWQKLIAWPLNTQPRWVMGQKILIWILFPAGWVAYFVFAYELLVR